MIPNKKPAAPHRHYVDKQRLYEEMKKRRKKKHAAVSEGKEPPRASDYIGDCIMKICVGLSHDKHFKNYTQHWLEEMRYDAIENCCAAIDKFDPEKSNNPFGYFTIIAYRAFLRRIDREKKNQYVKYKGLEKTLLQDNWQYSHDAAIHVAPEVWETTTRVVASYEETLARRAAKKELKAAEK